MVVVTMDGRCLVCYAENVAPKEALIVKNGTSQKKSDSIAKFLTLFVYCENCYKYLKRTVLLQIVSSPHFSLCSHVCACWVSIPVCNAPVPSQHQYILIIFNCL